MKIKINLNEEEIKDIITAYVLKEFPIDAEEKEICVTGLYSGCDVEIEEKVELTDENPEE